MRHELHEVHEEKATKMSRRWTPINADYLAGRVYSPRRWILAPDFMSMHNAIAMRWHLLCSGVATRRLGIALRWRDVTTQQKGTVAQRAVTFGSRGREATVHEPPFFRGPKGRHFMRNTTTRRANVPALLASFSSPSLSWPYDHGYQKCWPVGPLKYRQMKSQIPPIEKRFV